MKFYNDSDLLAGNHKIVRDGNDGLNKAKQALEHIISKGGDGNEELKNAMGVVKKQLISFDGRMQRTNGKLQEIFVRLGVGLMKEIKRVYLHAKEVELIATEDSYTMEEEYTNVLDLVAGSREEKAEGGGWTDDQLAGAMAELGAVYDRAGEEKLHDLTLTSRENDSNDLFANAVRCFAVASCFKPNDCDIMCRLGKTFEELGMSDIAIHVAKESLSLETIGGDHAESMYNLATSFESKKEYKKATKIFQRASELAARNGNIDLLSSSLRSIGVCLDGQHKWKEAAKAYAVASELAPSLPELVSARAISLKNGGFHMDAKTSFEHAAKLFAKGGMKDHVLECEQEAKDCEELGKAGEDGEEKKNETERRDRRDDDVDE